MVRTANIRTHVPRRSGAGGGTTFKSPDGLTTAKRRRTYHAGDYGASGSPRIFQGTSSGSVFTTTVDHDFEVGHHLVLLRAGANCSVLKPAVANGSLTPGGTPGSTTYRMAFSAFDGNGGQTGCGASDYVETTTGAATITETNYLEAKIPVPYGAAAIAVYFVAGTGAISTYEFVTILEVRAKFLASGAEPVPSSTATIDNNGGFVRLNVASHGFVNGDVVNFHSPSNPEYNGQHVITGNTGTTLTTSTAYGGATASGYYEPGFVTYRYKGKATTLHDQWFLPTDENPSWDWRASIARPRGNVVVDTAGGRLYRSEIARGSRRSGSVEPTWPASADSIVIDGEHTMRRCLDFVTVNPPAADIPGALFTFVSAVPATNQITLNDAPTNAIASSTPYLLAHNDLPAFRLAFAAAEASGRGGTVTCDGQPNFFFRKHTLDTNMSNVGSSTAPVHAALRCRSGILSLAQPTVSVSLDPNCIIRAHFMQCDGLMSDIAGSETAKSYYHLFHFGGERISIRGGAYEWQVFSGGLTEHNCPSNSHAQGGSWCYDQGNGSSTNLGTRPCNGTIADCRIDWPNIGASNGVSEYDNFSYRKMKLHRVQLHYGGSDGDQTFSTNHGDWDVDSCEFWNTRQFGSHALYFGVDRNIMTVRRSIFKEVFKNSIQMRGTGGNGYVKNVIISDCIGVNTGPLDVGDSTTSNQVHKIAISNCHGFNVSASEVRNLSIVGGTYGTVTLSEDIAEVKIAHLTLNQLVLAVTDLQYRVKVSNVNVEQQVVVAGAVTDASTLQGLDFENPHVPVTVFNGGIYAWESCGQDEYRLKLRSTGGDPSVSSPSALKIRENITKTAGVYQQLGGDTWYYGNTEVQTIAISGSPTGGSFTVTYNGNTSGSIAAGATAATVQTALRLVTGLSAVTVTQSGSGNNLTYRVAMTGVVGDPPQMTSTSSLTGGTPVITHATPVAYPGYDTLAVKINDSTRYNPDENSYGEVYSLTLGPAIKFGGTFQNCAFRDIVIRKTLVDDRSTYFGNNSGSAPTLNKVQFDNILFEHTGLAWNATGTVRMVDWGTAVMGYCDVEFYKCRWVYPRRSSSATHSEVRMAFTRGGQVTFRECEMLCFGSGHEILGPNGSVHLIGNKVQTNRAPYTCSTSADTFVHTSSGTTFDLGSGTSRMVKVHPYGHTAMPSPLVAGTIYYYNATTDKLYATRANADANASPLDITTGDGLVFELEFLDIADLSLHTSFEFIGDNSTPDLYGECRENIWRGSPVATYAALTGNVSDYQLLPLLRKHRLSSDASREIDGFNAPAGGSISREDQIWVVGSNDIVIKDDADTGSAAENRIAMPANADVTYAPNKSFTLNYDVQSQINRVLGV